MSAHPKVTHPVTRAALGIVALALIAVFANWLVSLLSVGSRGSDFTENRVHTLSDGTKSILGELQAPVDIRYYATRKSESLPRELKLYMRRVDDLLREYQSLAKGKLRVEYLDPQPDTDAEDSANLDGINGQRVDQEENLYFGLAVACLDRKTTIAFLDPNDETTLEYQLSRAVAEVSRPSKPVVGLMSGIPLAGGPAMMPGQQPQQQWVIHQQLTQAFEVRDLGMTPTSIDPDISVLLVIHPANITPEAEFAIDQYVLNGGTVIACLDAYSVAAQMTGGGNPMMGGGIPTTSTLPTLLSKWGLTFESGQVIADGKYRTRLNDGRIGAALLSLPKESMPQKDDVITKDLVDLYFVLPGGFTKTGGGGVSANTLVRTSDSAAKVDSMRASQLDQRLVTSLRPDGTVYDLVVHLAGKFKSAFPDGKPGEKKDDAKDEKKDDAKTAEAADAKKEGEKKDEAKPAENKPKWLTEGKADGHVFLIADVDFLYNNFAYRVQNLGGMQLAAPFNGNSSLLLNLIDQATGSKHLIGSRSRAATRRPFTVVQEMESRFEQEVGKKIAELEEKQKAAVERLNDLQSQKSRATQLFLSPEQEAQIKKLREEQVAYSRQIRDEQKKLKQQKDALAAKVTFLNVAAVPLLVVISGLAVWFSRRSSTRAR